MPSARKTLLSPSFHMGLGYDIHRLIPGKRIVLGGVRIPSKLSLEGHSDADVLLHAICDAMLGAASLGDIGKHFPNTDRKYRGISSLVLLKHVVRLLRDKKWNVVNIDSTVILESPKIGPHTRKMESRIARVVGVKSNCVSVKATTNEQLGSLGRSEGCAALAVALIQSSR